MYNRRSIRLKEYDYTQAGYYYVTICTLNRNQLFGLIIDNKMILNKFGFVVFNEWKNTSVIRENIELDEFIIMPDHIHGIIIINDRRGVMPYALKNTLQPNDNKIMNTDKSIINESTSDKRAYVDTPLRSPSKSVGSIIRGYKSGVTLNINKLRDTPKTKIWQRNYFERVIRNQNELDEIRLYIKNNPMEY